MAGPRNRHLPELPVDPGFYPERGRVRKDGEGDGVLIPTWQITIREGKKFKQGEVRCRGTMLGFPEGPYEKRTLCQGQGGPDGASTVCVSTRQGITLSENRAAVYFPTYERAKRLPARQRDVVVVNTPGVKVDLTGLWPWLSTLSGGFDMVSAVWQRLESNDRSLRRIAHTAWAYPSSDGGAFHKPRLGVFTYPDAFTKKGLGRSELEKARAVTIFFALQYCEDPTCDRVVAFSWRFPADEAQVVDLNGKEVKLIRPDGGNMAGISFYWGQRYWRFRPASWEEWDRLLRKWVELTGLEEVGE